MAVAVQVVESFIAPLDRHAVRLTVREQRILALATTGWSTAAIAETLGLSPETIRQSLASTIQRVGARSKMEAALIAVRRGLINLPADIDQPEADVDRYRPSAVRPVQRLLCWAVDADLQANQAPIHVVAAHRVKPARLHAVTAAEELIATT
jgi:DNA-binding CsgD family transcriptional regulator